MPSRVLSAEALTTADRAADLLWSAWTAGEVIDELPDDVRPDDHEAGWAVQQRIAERAGSAYGWKIAATSAPSQAVIGIGTPLPGRLFDRFRFEPGDTLPSAGLHMRVVEAEFAFRMGRDVPPGASREEVLEAVAAMHLAIEVPDSRILHFAKAGSSQLMADVACAGQFVLGREVDGWREAELSTWPATLWINGEIAARGNGAEVMGDPRTALVWLADELTALGTTLKAGEIITTGSTTPVPPISAGDSVRADFGDHGDVEISFT
ncbi:fumarylacetoacetate hydrolase family protein [Pseudonocardia ailaonensis]|uniref:Fumarylacetoacetate hydrolase family protein n=1 Tax=Pseudonocardia ailaonensis TaxID=367279 RepID=A0ABN2NHZ8_9PSEU